MRVVVDAESCVRGLRRVAGEIVERHGTGDVVLVGVRRGGVPVAEQIAQWVGELEGRPPPPVGTVDITLYRDDAATALPNPRIGPSELPDVTDRTVIIVDDVVFTGRTIRAALEGILDHGRPRRIELAALVDRGGRELPIQPDYVVRRIEVREEERVEVVTDDAGRLTATLQRQEASCDT